MKLQCPDCGSEIDTNEMETESILPGKSTRSVIQKLMNENDFLRERLAMVRKQMEARSDNV